MTAPLPYPRWLAREERQADRQSLSLGGTANGARIAPQPVEMIDLSPLGCRLRVERPIAVGSYVALASGDAPRLEGWVVWSNGAECGIDFAQPVPAVAVEQITAACPR